MIRDDISNKLIHLVKGDNLDEASEILFKIVAEGKLRGGTQYIKGNFTCVCFSEAPISKLSQILALPTAHGFRYKPFGVMVDKTWLFVKGGRPVIYQSDSEYNLLNDEQKYRHVRYEPPNIDFTWEREWRIKTKELILDPHVSTLIVPDRHWAEKLIKRYISSVRGTQDIFGITVTYSNENYKWHFIALEELGVLIPDDQELAYSF